MTVPSAGDNAQQLTVRDDIEIEFDYYTLRDRLLADPVVIQALNLTAKSAARDAALKTLRSQKNLGGQKVTPTTPPQARGAA